MTARDVIRKALRKGSKEYFGRHRQLHEYEAERLAKRILRKLEKYGHLCPEDQLAELTREGA